MTEEIYPMPFFVNLIVSNLDASSQFYQETLGFKHVFTMPGPGGKAMLVHLRWSKYADLLLSLPRDGKPLPESRGAGVSLSFQMPDYLASSVDALADQAKAGGATIASGPLDQPWNVRELMILDPDGYQLVFTAPLNANLDFDEVLKRVASER
ncbi:MAG TPA: VOC family protein [Anaerolineales bacterium]|nr:VOC family protein [Anaerolineales bacterium]